MVGRIRPVRGGELFLAIIGAWFILAIVAALFWGAFIRRGHGPR
jgi:hypothetical protein